MKQKSNNQKFHPAVGILGGLTILMGILFLADVMFGDRLGANLWPLRIIVPGVALFFGTLPKSGWHFFWSLPCSLNSSSGWVVLAWITAGRCISAAGPFP